MGQPFEQRPLSAVHGYQLGGGPEAKPCRGVARRIVRRVEADALVIGDSGGPRPPEPGGDCAGRQRARGAGDTLDCVGI